MTSINVNPTLLAVQNLGNRIQRSNDGARDFKTAVARVGADPQQRPQRPASNATSRNSAQTDSGDFAQAGNYAGQNASNLSARGAAAALPNRRPLPPGSLLNIVV